MSNQQQALDFDEVANLIVSLGANMTPSELHGLLSGQLAAGKRMNKDSWLQEAALLLDATNSFSPDNQEKLQFIHMATLTALTDDSLSFYPLIPNEDLEMELRLQCLGLWCSGFLAGFALVEKQIAELPELVNDALNDLAAISQVGSNEDEDLDETAEQDFFQIIEYIRLAAMNIYMEYAVTATSPKALADSLKNNDSEEYLGSEQLFKGRKVH